MPVPYGFYRTQCGIQRHTHARHDLCHWAVRLGLVILKEGACSLFAFSESLVSGVFVAPESQNSFSMFVKGALQLGTRLGQCGHLNNANPSNLEHRQSITPLLYIIFSHLCGCIHLPSLGLNSFYIYFFNF